MKNHYEILEIDPTASSEEIDKAFNNLSKQFHPDNNGGVKYFDDLFVQIKDAYQVLSEETLRINYDREQGFIKHSEIEVATLSAEPEILLFEVDKKVFEEGDEIKITWQTRNADNVVIDPFGEVETSGSKIYRLKNYRKEILIITLDVINSETGETANRSITLQNKVTEFDFSNLDDKHLEEENNEAEVIDEPLHPNPFPISSEESFFSTTGRLRRRQYLVRAILLGIPAAMAASIIETSYDDTTIGISVITVLICAFLILIQFVKRLHDINLSGWWSLISFVPYLGGLFGFIVLFIDGQKGPNKYGHDPKGRL